MIHITGVCLISFCMFLYGVCKAWETGWRIQKQLELQDLLEQLKSELRYGYEALDQVFQHMSETSASPYSEWLSFLACRIRDKKQPCFFLIWKEGIQEYLATGQEMCPREALFRLMELGKVLGQADLALQIRMIERTEEYLNHRIVCEMHEKKGKQKLYYTLGATGAAIVLVLFI